MNFIKCVFTVIFIFIFSFCSSQIDGNEKLINSLKSLPELKNASLSLYAKNIKTDSVILEYNSELSLSPASVFKIFPTSLALEILGPHYKFKTEIAYTGVIDTNGVLNGDIYIIGYGDPCLGSENFQEHYNKNSQLLQIWANAVKNAGINKINGKLIADASYFGKININGKWLWEDVANHYGTTGSSLNYNDNLFYIYFNTSKTEGGATEIVRVIPSDLGLEFNNEVISSKSNYDDAYIFYNRDSYKLDIRGTLPMNRTDFKVKGALPEPEKYLLGQFEKALKICGVQVSGNKDLICSRNKNLKIHVLHTTYSPELSEIVKITNQISQNLYAEILSYHVAKKLGKDYQDIVKEYLKIRNIDNSGLYIYDACGLSRFNGLTARQMTEFLIYIKTKSPTVEYFINSLPVYGVSGSFSKYVSGKESKNVVYTKSGSMTKVRSYAGYIINKRGEEIAFCFIANNFACPGYQMRKIFENLFVEIANLD